MSDDSFTIKEIVEETRDDVKELRDAVAQLPTSARVRDHEVRLRRVEKRAWALPTASLVAAGAIVAALIESGVV